MSGLILPEPVLQAVRAHALETAPDECVGLLFGRGDRVARRVPLTNVSPVPRTHFFADPQELFRALKDADARGDDLLASYHSHPHSAPFPSEVDHAAAWWGAVQLIVTPNAVKGFRLVGCCAEEVRLEVGGD